jgi:protein ImuA
MSIAYPVVSRMPVGRVVAEASESPVVAPPIPDLHELRRLVKRLEGGERCVSERGVVSTGCEALDRLLPQGGLRRGTVVEWAGGGEGGGAGTLALAAARQACLAGGLLVVLDRDRIFYPPVLAAWGMALRNVVVVRPERVEDELWAADQALRCPAVAAVWGRFDELSTRDQRRLQLAAEEGGALGLFRRPARCVGQPTWADVQWSVRPLNEESPGGENGEASGVSLRQLLVTLTRCRGAPGGESVRVVWDEWSGELREVRRVATRDLAARNLAAREPVAQQSVAQQSVAQQSVAREPAWKAYVDQQADCLPAVPSLATPALVRRA